MSTTERHAYRALISGKVQGVGYRDWARKAAAELGLEGWVRNLEDGRVELWAEGPREALEELRQRAAQGPRFAHVQQVQVDGVVPRGAVGFERRPTAAAPEPLTSGRTPPRS